MVTLVWVHDGAISRDHPVFARAGDADAVFIFDAEHYRVRGYSLKRLVFIMECAVHAGFDIREGRYTDILQELTPTELFVARTPDPDHKIVIDTLRKTTKITVVKERPFATIDREPDLRRFFRYWKRAKKSVMKPDA